MPSAICFSLDQSKILSSGNGLKPIFCFGFFRLLSSLSVAHLSDASRRRLVVTRDSARKQDETTESSAWCFNVIGA